MSSVNELLDEKPDGLTRLLHPVAKAEFINLKAFNAWGVLFAIVSFPAVFAIS